MLRKVTATGNDRGATALFLAFTMFLLMGMGAVAIDVGAGFVERRADQAAADVGAVAGALEVLIGTSGGGVSADDMVTSAIEYVRLNLPMKYNDADWQALWEGCVDPASERNTESGDDFVAMNPPAGWIATDAANWCISMDAAKSLFRVRTPDQLVPTTFARVIGFDSLNTHAAAVVNILPAGAGILPFGLPTGVADGVQHCLSSGPSGLAVDPCEGSDSGNFGTLKARQFGDTPYNGCNVSPLNPVLALNISRGMDHPVVPDSDGLAANEVRDLCYNVLVDTLNTDTGFPQGTGDGLITGNGLPAGDMALLKQGQQPKISVVGHDIDNQPLWYWLRSTFVRNVGTPPMPTIFPIDFGGRLTPLDISDDAPLFCDPAGFTTGPYEFEVGVPVFLYDFDGDMTDDALESWQHMQRCLQDYAEGKVDSVTQPLSTGASFVVIFSSSLGDREGSNWSPRFSFVPQFYETSLGSGNSWNHILRFRAVFIEGVFWKQGGSSRVHYPGEPCIPSCSGNDNQIKQVSAWVIPDAALPSSLRGDPPGAAGFINPFTVTLRR